MGEFSVRLDLMKNSAEEEKIFTGELNGIETQIEDVRLRLRWKISAEAGIRERLGRLHSDIEQWKGAMESVHTQLDQSIIKYETTEMRLLGNDSRNNEKAIDMLAAAAEVNGYATSEKPNLLEGCKNLYNNLKEGYEALKGGIDDVSYSCGQFIEDSVHNIDELMEFVNSHVQESRQWLADAIACDGVVVIGTSIIGGAVGNVDVGLQIAIDANGDMYYQLVPAAGLKVGAAVSGDVSIGILPGKTCKDTEGLGAAAGITVGEALVLGSDVLLVPEDGGLKPVGLQISLGGGVEGMGADAHANMSETYTFYKTNIIAKDWDRIYDGWSKTKEVWEKLYH